MRIKVKLPTATPQYHTTYAIGIQELNYGNHLANDKVLSIAHEARVRFFQSIDQSELDFFDSGLIMAGAQIQYKSQGHYGDQLKIKLWLDEDSKYGFKVYTQLIKEDTEVARVEVDMLFFNYKEQKLTEAPKAYRDYRMKL